jgi:hypothetical protein
MTSEKPLSPYFLPATVITSSLAGEKAPMYFVSFSCGFRYNYWTIPVLFEVPYPEANGNG